MSDDVGGLRYLHRTWLESGTRAGALFGGCDSLKWSMIHHIAVTQRANRRRAAALFESLALPKIALTSRRQITSSYEAEGLRHRATRTG